MEQFETRDLKAFSAEPLLVYPTHYTGDPGYISDTETSTVWDNDKVRTDWDRARSGKTREQAEISTEAQNSDVLQSALDSTARDELWEEADDSFGSSRDVTPEFLETNLSGCELQRDQVHFVFSVLVVCL